MLYSLSLLFSYICYKLIIHIFLLTASKIDITEKYRDLWRAWYLPQSLSTMKYVHGIKYGQLWHM